MPRDTARGRNARAEMRLVMAASTSSGWAAAAWMWCSCCTRSHCCELRRAGQLGTAVEHHARDESLAAGDVADEPQALAGPDQPVLRVAVLQPLPAACTGHQRAQLLDGHATGP